jgi:TolB-like protein/tetratricopeptide (TPR) repeat protein
MSLLGEIKRRKVFQVAAVYAVVAWLLVQIVDVVNEPLGLPDWFDTAVIMALAIGFPIALILAWAFDLTPEGIVKDTGATSGSSRRIETVFIALLAVAVGTLLYREFTPASEDDTSNLLPNSIAVLPFENLSPDPDDAFFAGGLHDELLNRLAKIGELNVIARTSVMQYEGVGRPIQEIATELAVETIMEGTVRYADGQVRLTAQLNDGLTGTHIWSESYTRPFENIFEIETEIASAIASALEVQILGHELESISQTFTASPEAHEFYLRAIEVLWSFNTSFAGERAASVAKSYLDQAIEIDPNFALAHAMKAYLHQTPGEVQLARESAETALQLDENLGLAHAILGNLHKRQWREDEARNSFAEALRLSPSDPLILYDYMLLLLALREFEDAFDVVDRLLELDPDNLDSFRALGLAHQVAGNVDQAIAAYREGLRIDPVNALINLHLGHLERRIGNLDEAVAALEVAVRFMPNDSIGTAGVAYALSLVGREADASVLASQWQQRFGDDPFMWPEDRALSYLAFQDYDQALAVLREAAQNEIAQGFGMTLLKENVYGDPVLDRPEFVEARSALGFRE